MAEKEKVDKNKMGWVQDREKLRQAANPIGRKAIERNLMLRKRIKDRKTAARLRKRAAHRGGSRR
ncbi:MAG: hypothetical protein IIB03_06665 [Acidobacteria bacterium]|nr:hypothetical protein [Acidobacteriota bacterium]